MSHPLSFDVLRPLTALNPERLFLLRHVGFDKTIVRAEGSDLFDREGAHYLDALAQYGALPFGHNPDFIWRRVFELRAAHEPSFVQPLLNPGAERLAQQLIGLVPHMAHVTFVNSGAEATELAIKLARARTRRPRIVSVERGFHGKTNAALCATANADYREPFLLDDRHFGSVPFGDLDALDRTLRAGDVAAFLVEPVQGEGGMRVQPSGYLGEAQRLCRSHGTLFVLDEVQTGLGRTGELMGFMHHGPLEPDVLLLAKALGGGLFPLGAVMCTARAWSEPLGLLHSSTFANSHLGTTIGSATLDALLADASALLQHVRHCAALLRAGLSRIAQRYPEAIGAVHGQGLMQGLELKAWSGATSYFNAHVSYRGHAVPIVAGYLLNRRGLLTAPTLNRENVLRVQPALTISEAQIGTILDALEATVQVIAGEDFAELFSCMVPEIVRGRTHPLRREALVPRPAATAAVRRPRFGFLIHPVDEDSLLDTLPQDVRPDDARVRAAWLGWLHSWSSKMRAAAPVFHLERIDSPTGASAEGWLIACTLTPSELIRLDAAERDRLLGDHVAVARELQVDMLGLGAFHSVISRGGTALLGCGLNLTTGNGLTAIASVESALHHASRRFGSQPLRCAVIGAAGSVGRLVAIHLARRGAAELWLIGNPGNRAAERKLEAVASEIAIRRDESQVACTTHITTDLALGLREAQLVVTATSAGRAFLEPQRFGAGAIVCDVARPLDVFRRVAAQRADLLILEGGLMTMPGAARFGHQNVLGYPAGVNLSCLCETIALTLDRAGGHYSIGDQIDYQQAIAVFRAAQRHGFAPYTGLLQSTSGHPLTTASRVQPTGPST